MAQGIWFCAFCEVFAFSAFKDSAPLHVDRLPIHMLATILEFPWTDMAWPALVVTLGYVALGLTGFASALISVPLLAWRWPLVDVVPLVLVMDVVASVLMGGLNLREVRWGELRYLGPGMLAGGLVGLWLATRMTSALPLLVLGAYVAWVGVQALRQRAVPAVAPPPPPPGLGALYGAGVGGVLMLFATGGPLLLAWLARRGFDARAMRATTPALIVVAVLMVLLMMAANGRLSSPLMWQRLLVLLPIAVIGVLVGHALAHRVPVATLRRVICALLVVSGVMLMLNAVNRML